MSAPSAARANACARPCPRAPPVIKATRPSKAPMDGYVSWGSPPPGLQGDAIEVAREDGVDVGGCPPAPAEVLPEGQQRLRQHPLDDAPPGVVLVEQVRVAREFVK